MVNIEIADFISYVIDEYHYLRETVKDNKHWFNFVVSWFIVLISCILVNEYYPRLTLLGIVIALIIQFHYWLWWAVVRFFGV